MLDIRGVKNDLEVKVFQLERDLKKAVDEKHAVVQSRFVFKLTCVMMPR